METESKFRHKMDPDLLQHTKDYFLRLFKKLSLKSQKRIYASIYSNDEERMLRGMYEMITTNDPTFVV